MENGNALENLIRSTRQYELKDGLREIQIGLYLLAISLTLWLGFQPFWLRFLLQINKTGDKGLYWITLLAAMLSPVAALALIQLLIRFLRARFLWAESGSVQPNRRLLPVSDTLVAAVIALAVIGAGFLLTEESDMVPGNILRWVFSGAGLSLAYPLFVLGKRYDLPRMKWEALAGVGLSLLLLWLPFSTLPGPVLAFGAGWALLLCAGGGAALRQAWRQKGAKSHAG